MMRPHSSIVSLFVVAASVAVSVTGQTTVKLDSNSFGAIEARHIGPAVTSGRIAAIDGVASDPRILYVGSAGGGVWKSIKDCLLVSPTLCTIMSELLLQAVSYSAIVGDSSAAHLLPGLHPSADLHLHKLVNQKVSPTSLRRKQTEN